MKITLDSFVETERLGRLLWEKLPEKCLVFLQGELGAGKTTLVRGVLNAAGYQKAVKSPTYTLVEEYHLAERDIYHFDLYRLNDPEELEWIGMDDYLQQNALCFIEWPQMGQGFLPDADLEINLIHDGDRREAVFTAVSEKIKNNLQLNWKNKDILL